MYDSINPNCKKEQVKIKDIFYIFFCLFRFVSECVIVYYVSETNFKMARQSSSVFVKPMELPYCIN